MRTRYHGGRCMKGGHETAVRCAPGWHAACATRHRTTATAACRCGPPASCRARRSSRQSGPSTSCSRVHHSWRICGHGHVPISVRWASARGRRGSFACVLTHQGTTPAGSADRGTCTCAVGQCAVGQCAVGQCAGQAVQLHMCINAPGHHLAHTTQPTAPHCRPTASKTGRAVTTSGVSNLQSS